MNNWNEPMPDHTEQIRSGEQSSVLYGKAYSKESLEAMRRCLIRQGLIDDEHKDGITTNKLIKGEKQDD